VGTVGGLFRTVWATYDPVSYASMTFPAVKIADVDNDADRTLLLRILVGTRLKSVSSAQQFHFPTSLYKSS
jgi:hypothetical protein